MDATSQLRYRMHPAISKFPSANFYKGAVKDARNVKMRPHPLLPPRPPTMQQPSPHLPPPLPSTSAAVDAADADADADAVAGDPSSYLAASAEDGRCVASHQQTRPHLQPQLPLKPPARSTHYQPFVAPYCFVDVDGGSEQVMGSKSVRNVVEAQTCIRVLQSLVDAVAKHNVPAKELRDCVILTFYVAQKLELEQQLRRAGLERSARVHTVDSFQGSEVSQDFAKPPLATDNLLENTDGVLRPPPPPL